MHQTVGSQIFGPWYDIIGHFLASAAFIYMPFYIEILPYHIKKRMPAFLLKKRTLLIMAALMAMLGTIKFIELICA